MTNQIDYNSIEWSDVAYYDESSPSCLRWKEDIYSGRNKTVLTVSKGSSAGYMDNSRGYFRVKYKQRVYSCHRIIWTLHHGHIENKLQVDHINGEKHNNSITNLRLVPPVINLRNRQMQANNTSGFNGVSLVINAGYSVSWRCPLSSKINTKFFSFRRYGEDAFMTACDYRIDIIKMLNSDGAGYTTRHGS